MKAWILGLASALALSASAVGQEVIVSPAAPVVESAAPTATYQEGVAEMPAPSQGRFRTFFNKHGLCCASHFEWFGCASFHSQMTFMFSGCRTFFGEPCFPKEARDRVGVLGSARGEGCASCGR